MAHRYWRILTTRAYSTTITAIEIEFRSTLGGADETVPGGAAYASSAQTGTTAAGAFADDANTTFLNQDASTTSMSQWVAYDFGAGNEKDIVEVAWTTGTSISRNPRDCQLQWSNDNVAWTTAFSFYDVPEVTASNVTTIYSHPAADGPLVTKTGYHIVQAQWGNNAAVTKGGFQLIVSAFPDDAISATKAAIQYITAPILGVRIAHSNPYAVFEREEDARITAMRSYVVFRPTPPPPRKTIVVIGPGARFGGSGQNGQLSAFVEQAQDFEGVFSVSKNLAAVLEQESTFAADLYVDNEIEDVFLLANITQSSTFSASFLISHDLSAMIEQESVFAADLSVEDSAVDHFLVGAISQTNAVEADLDVAVVEPTGKDFWRLFIIDNSGISGFITVGEVEFAATPGVPMDGSDLTGSGLGTASASSTSSASYAAEYAFNNTYTFNTSSDPGRYWQSNGLNTNQWLQWAFPTGTNPNINQVRVMADRQTVRSPRNMRIESSVDGITWETEWEIPTQESWPPGEWRTFTRPGGIQHELTASIIQGNTVTANLEAGFPSLLLSSPDELEGPSYLLLSGDQDPGKLLLSGE